MIEGSAICGLGNLQNYSTPFLTPIWRLMKVVSGKNSVQIPATAWLVFVKGPQRAAVGVTDDEIIAAAIVAVPPTALDAFGAGENFIVFDGTAFGFWQQPTGAVRECGAVCLLIQCTGAPAVFRAVILYAGNAGD